MVHLHIRSRFTSHLIALAVLLVLAPAGFGQSFRGGIVGVVADPSGAVVTGAQVTIDAGTNSTYKAVSSSAGEFSFPNLPLGDYSVTVTEARFNTKR
jgi:hypothetical protein